ncbi:hypothetical protein OMAG_000983 [Candidatus Omnitrophus magneticus]|uniref:Uncharacterized protein n=1 Tax=Candidatus Omnitrophus magneticus TaxID=1609969 RepID=A0A0F0CUG5_9BACT|nr:hypothetical protein OMAG_000983 [Candidatus Omnitrophus magneticus]
MIFWRWCPYNYSFCCKGFFLSFAAPKKTGNYVTPRRAYILNLNEG